MNSTLIQILVSICLSITCTASSILSQGAKSSTNSVPAILSASTEEVVYGDAGRLYVADHSVALYDNFVQKVCDRQDSACYDDDAGFILIADHCTQGFDAIKKVAVGDTCCIRTKDGQEEIFVCKRIDTHGKNDKKCLYDNKGRSIYKSGYDLIMYTCNENWRSIWIVFWDHFE